MSIGPDLALQAALIACLKAAYGVTAIVGDRIFDRVPDLTAYPHVEIGELQVIPEDIGCLETACEVYATLHAWSRTVGAVEARGLADAVRRATHHASLTLSTGWALVDLWHHDTRVFTDADGLSTHAVVTLRAMIDPA